MVIGRSWRKGEVNNAAVNGRTKRKVPENAIGMEQRGEEIAGV